MLRSKASRWAAAPYLVWMVLFIVVPLGIVVWYALTNSDGQVTLANLTSIGRYASVFGRSLLLAAEATIICLVLAFPVGYFLSRLRANKQHIMLMLVMLPMWMNFLLRTYAWMTLLEKNGLINKLLGLFGIGPFNMINTSGAVVLGMVYNYLPYAAVHRHDQDRQFCGGSCAGPGSQCVPDFRPRADPAEQARHCHRHYHGVCSGGFHLYYQPYAGRRR